GSALSCSFISYLHLRPPKGPETKKSAGGSYYRWNRSGILTRPEFMSIQPPQTAPRRCGMSDQARRNAHHYHPVLPPMLLVGSIWPGNSPSSGPPGVPGGGGDTFAPHQGQW